MEELAERVPSLTVRVWVPAVFKVLEKIPLPEERTGEEGRLAFESEEVMFSVPP